MKKSLKTLLAALIAVMMVFVFTACGSPSTLEEYVDQNSDTQTEIDEAVSGLGGSTLSTDLEIKDNAITVTMTSKSTYTDDQIDQMKTYFDSLDDTFESSAESLIDTLEEETEIDGITVEFIFKNGDGSEVWTGSYD